ncbi:ficolin-2-like [Drosophila tropicalis]|uniref:ficolin-2-like n=1 Tax=Drosophila tropicalis TaxID=46794 RepID=UPI0035ABF99D
MTKVLKGIICLFLLQGITAQMGNLVPKEWNTVEDDKCVTYCFSDLITLANHIARMNQSEETPNESIAKINRLDKELQICRVKLNDQVAGGNVMQELAAQKALLEAKEEIVKELKAQLKKDTVTNTVLLSAFNSLKAQVSKFFEGGNLGSIQQEENLPNQGLYVEGVRRIQLAGHPPFEVPYITPISSWTVIQRRIDPRVNFDRNWHDYKKGFGNAKENFFVGLDNLYLILKTRPYELYIQLGDINGKVGYARYDNFKISGEGKNYQLLSVGNYTGTAGDSLSSHVGAFFSTHDRHNNLVVQHNCALGASGGWWYTSCGESKLNGWFHINGLAHKNGITWGTWADPNQSMNLQSLTFVQMMIRPTA